MKRNELVLLDIDLASFDGEGGAGAGVGTGSESGVAPTTAAQGQAPKVLYGKQEGDLGDGQAHTEGEPAAQNQPDPSAEFENLIKGQYKEQFDARIQSIIDKRFKGTKDLEARLGELSPIMDLLMEKYEAKDMNELKSKFENETLEELAYRKNMDVDTYREFREAKALADQMKEYQNSVDVQAQIDQKVADWYSQADTMKKADYPDFDFKSYVNEQPEFLKLLNAGVPVKQAYELLNLDNIKANTAKQAQANTVKSIQANGTRPREAAAQANNGTIIKSSVSSWTKADREEVARRAQRGETIRL